MLSETDGFVGIEIDGAAFELSPSFFNINKLGNPREIIKTFESVVSFDLNKVYRFKKLSLIEEADESELKRLTISFLPLFTSNTTPVSSFIEALRVLKACGLDDAKVTGSIAYSEKNKCTVIVEGIIPYDEIFILAQHCLKHAICGNSKQIKKEKNKDGSKIKEFNPNKFVISANGFLGMSFDEAWGLSMTKYINLANAKMEDMRARGELDESKEQDPELDKMVLERHNAIIAKNEERRKNRLSKRGKS